MPITLEHNNYSGRIRAHRVYAKVNWADDWELKEHLVCTTCRWTTAPQIGSAEMYYRYGHGIIPGNPEAGYLNRFTLPTLAFVKIEFDVIDLSDPLAVDAESILYWYGVVGSLVEKHGGAIDVGSGPVQQGVQQLNAVGLEWLLDRQYIMSCFFTNWDESSEPAKSRYAIGFNLPLRDNNVAEALGTPIVSQQSPNKTIEVKTIGTQQTKIFCDVDPDDMAEGEYWSSREIVEYLLATQTPRNVGDDGSLIPWELDDPDGLLPDWDRPELEQHGLRIWQILNQVIARQRCLGFYLDVDGSGATAVVKLIPFTFTDSNIYVPNTANYIKANPNQDTLEITNDLTADFATSTDCFSKYDQVKVIGARAVHVATLLIDHGIEKAWTTAEETAYMEGAQGESGFPAATEIHDRQVADIAFRHRPEFDHVFRKFRIAKDWDLKALYNRPVFPSDPNGAPLTWEPGPHLFDTIYIVPIPKVLESEEQLNSLRSCKLFVYDETNNRSWDAELIKAARIVNGEEHNFAWSASIRPGKDPCEFDVVVSGESKHVIDSANVTHLDWDPDIGSDYGLESHAFTLGLTADYFCESSYPANEDLGTTTDYHRVRYIDAGEKYRLAFLVKGTVMATKTDESDYEIAEDSHYMIDDRDLLLDIATQAYAWYGRDRVSMSLQTGLITNAISLGQMITSVDVGKLTVELNTVITSITLQHSVGNGVTVPPPRISYQTEHADFDFVNFATQK